MATPVGTGTKSQRIEPLTKRKTWKALQIHYEKVRKLHLRDLFAADPKRGERMTAEAVGLFLDYSKNRITDETVKLLIELAEESGLRARIDAMFQGEKINITEKRAVLHVALRAPKGTSILVEGEDDKKVREWLMTAAGVRPGVHRLRCEPDGLLGAARWLAGQEDNAGRRCGRDRPPLPGVCGHF
jgi:phosphoglucose isomerase-like protein